MQKPESGLAPAPKTTARYQLQQALNWTASELHAAVGPLFRPGLSAEIDAFLRGRVADKLKTLNDVLLKGGRKHLVGDAFTVADAYCAVVLSWFGHLKIDLAPYENVATYFAHIMALPNVKAAQERMGAAPATVC